MTERLPAITRPNGKVYRPHKVVAYDWRDDNAWDTATWGVVVFGTHDVELARPLAARTSYLPYVVNPRRGWWRDGFANGERAWIYDDVHGRAGVMFDGSNDPEEVESREVAR